MKKVIPAACCAAFLMASFTLLGAVFPEPGVATELPSPQIGKIHKLNLYPESRMKDFGGFDVYVFDGTDWQKHTYIGFDKFYRNRTIELSGLPETGTLRVKLVQHGGGAAQLDSVRVNGVSAGKVKAQDVAADRALKAFDLDVLPASEREFEFEFDGVGSTASLSVGARVEPLLVGHVPFNFPTQNALKDMQDMVDQDRLTYIPYKLDQTSASIQVDGHIAETSHMRLIFDEVRATSSGHPAGDIAGWLANDQDYLYAAFDFTPDNTIEDNRTTPDALDYAELWLRTEDGQAPKVFRVSGEDKRYGSPGFQPTDRAVYPHMTYELKIPLEELGVDPAKTDAIQVAASLFGTGSDGDYHLDIAHNHNSNDSMLTFYRHDESGSRRVLSYAQLLDFDGSPIGGEALLSRRGINGSDKMAAIAAVGSSDEYLAIELWDFSPTKITAITVAPGGATNIVPGAISMNISGGGSIVSPAYDAERDRFLVAIEKNDNTFAKRFVDSDGSTIGAESVVASYTAYQMNASFIRAENLDRFLALWIDNDREFAYAGLLDGDGAAVSTSFEVVDGAGENISELRGVYNSSAQQWVIGYCRQSSENLIIKRFDKDLGALSGTFEPGVLAECYRDPFDLVYNEQRGDIGVAYIRDNNKLTYRTLNDNLSAKSSAATISESTTMRTIVLEANNNCGNDILGWSNQEETLYEYFIATIGDDCGAAIGEVEDLDLGDVEIGTASITDVAIKNIGWEEDLGIGSVSFSSADGFSVNTDNCDEAEVAGNGGSCLITVTFSPQSTGEKTITITVPSDDVDIEFDVVANGIAESNTGSTTLTAPTLVYPVNGQSDVPVNAEFVWTRVSGATNYELSVCENQDFTDCDPLQVASLDGSHAPLKTALWPFSVLLLGVGLVWAGRSGRMLAVVAALGMAACSVSIPSLQELLDELGLDEDQVASQQVTGLISGTQYYWKVKANYGSAGSGESAVWAFTTE